MKSIVRISAIALLFVSFLMIGYSQQAHAASASSYNAQKAIQYAQQHWDDSKAYDGGTVDCVKFVKSCVEAGGIPKENRSYGYTPEDYVKYIKNNGLANFYDLKLTPQSWNNNRFYVDGGANIGKVSSGDILVYYCTKKDCPKPYFHLELVGDADYRIATYSHNEAKNNEEVCTFSHSGATVNGKYVKCGSTDKDIKIQVLHFKSKANGYTSVSGVSAKRASYNTIKVSWKATAGATGYKVYKKTSKNGTWKLLITTSKTSITNKIATIGHTYYYRVAPYKKIYQGGKTATMKGYYSSTVSAKTYLAKPVNLSVAKVGTGKLKASWSKMAGATGYQVYRATSKNGTYTKILTTKNNYCTDTKRVKGKTYWYKVRSYNVTNGKTSYSSFSTPYGKIMK